MAAVTVTTSGANFVSPTQKVISNGWVGSVLQRKTVPNRTVGCRTLHVTIAADGDTLTITNWRDAVPRVTCIAATENTAVSAYPVLSGTTLTITFQTDAASTAFIEIAPPGALQS